MCQILSVIIIEIEKLKLICVILFLRVLKRGKKRFFLENISIFGEGEEFL